MVISQERHRSSFGTGDGGAGGGVSWPKKIGGAITILASLAGIGSFLDQVDSGSDGTTAVQQTTTAPGAGTGAAGGAAGAHAEDQATSTATAVVTPAADPAVWTGSIRITDHGVNLGGRQPATGDGAFATILFKPSQGTYSTNNSHSVGVWTGAGEPSRADCASAIGSQSLSFAEAHAIVYQPGLGLCIRAFDGGNLTFVRLTAAPDATSGQATAIIWAR